MHIVKLELTPDEALVLFEWFARMDEQDAFPCEDESERLVLWSLHGQLETRVPETYRPDYGQLVAQARARVRANQRAGGGG